MRPRGRCLSEEGIHGGGVVSDGRQRPKRHVLHQESFNANFLTFVQTIFGAKKKEYKIA